MMDFFFLAVSLGWVFLFIATSNIQTGMEFDYTSQKWKHKAEKIKRRDGYKCRWCARYGKAVPAAVVHHIKHADEYPELAYVDDNLVSLCQACHNKAHPEKARAAKGRR